MEYLDFEEPIKDLHQQIEKCKDIGNESSVDVSETCDLLELKLTKTMKEIYGNLNAWQRVQLSRHPSRPYTLDYINYLTNGFGTLMLPLRTLALMLGNLKQIKIQDGA